MSRFNTKQLNNISILSVAEQLGINVGRNKKAFCFIHSEKTPSLSFDLGKNLWHCFGCDAGGSVIDLVMKYNNISFSDACKWLQTNFVVSEPTKNPAKSYKNPRVKKIPAEKKPVDTSLYSAIISGLSLSDNAADYLCNTRALSIDVVNKNHIVSIENIAEFYNMAVNTYGEERLLAGGFLKLNDFGELKFSWWNPGIVFPYYSYDGDIVNLQLRPYSDSQAKYIFLNKIPTSIYNEQLLKEMNSGDTLYLCEGAMDALSLATTEYNAVGIPGAAGFQNSWIDYIGRFNIVILFDNDDAGRKNAEVLRIRLAEKNINVRVMNIPGCFKDVNEMLIAERKSNNVK